MFYKFKFSNDKKIYRIIEVDFENWGPCNVLLENVNDCKDHIYTNYDSIEEVHDVHCQLSIFDFGAFYE